MSTSRREFLHRSAAAFAASATCVAAAPRSFANVSANDRPRIGCIGLGSMGKGDAREHARFGDLVALCDVDRRHLEQAQGEDQIGRGKASLYGDYRQLLELPDIDVVSIVTPDHWHVKIAIEALEAGKHVFCQKPLTLTLEENQLIRAACQKHPDRVFVVGTQQRSDRQTFLRAVNMVQKGLLGDIQRVTVGIDGAPTGGPFPVVAPPSELDWDMWLGQAPKVDFRERRCHYEFRWWYEYSGGKFTDWGAHHIDIATWALNRNNDGDGPRTVDGTDAHHPVPFEKGYPVSDDCYNTSHDFAVKCRYEDGLEMIVTSRGDNGILFEGTRGRLFVNRGRISGKPIEEDWDAGYFGQEDLQRLYKGKPFEGHKENFFRTLREGGQLVSDVASHLQTMNVCHLCAIAARLGRVVEWDPRAEQIMGDHEAEAMMRREQRRGFELPSV